MTWSPPESNLLENYFEFGTKRGAISQQVAHGLERAYTNGFSGCFCASESALMPVIESSKELRDQFFSVARFPDFNAEYSKIAGTGESLERALFFNYVFRCYSDAFRYYQDYGSCTYASLGSKGIPQILSYQKIALESEVSIEYPVSLVWYSTRGYCADGSYLHQAAIDFETKGVPFRKKYSQIDLTEEDYDEYVGARLWCRSGPPSWFLNEVKNQGRIGTVSYVEYPTWEQVRDILANGGILHTGSNATAKSSGDPVSTGTQSIGGHAQVLGGYDNSEEFRDYYKEKTGKVINEPVLIWHQTWGNWNNVTNWPTFWGKKPQGAFVLTYSAAKKMLGECYVYYPNATGFTPNPIVWST